MENIVVGDHSVIGAGSLVLCDIPDLTLAFGRPAKVIKKRKIGDPYLGNYKEQVSVSIRL
jgi:acetyltransferase-like isoleucine patch superfamily enzyme